MWSAWQACESHLTLNWICDVCGSSCYSPIHLGMLRIRESKRSLRRCCSFPGKVEESKRTPRRRCSFLVPAPAPWPIPMLCVFTTQRPAMHTCVQPLTNRVCDCLNQVVSEVLHGPGVLRQSWYQLFNAWPGNVRVVSITDAPDTPSSDLLDYNVFR